MYGSLNKGQVLKYTFQWFVCVAEMREVVIGLFNEPLLTSLDSNVRDASLGAEVLII